MEPCGWHLQLLTSMQEGVHRVAWAYAVFRIKHVWTIENAWLKHSKEITKKYILFPHLAEYLLLITGRCKLKMKLLCNSSLELWSAETAALKFPVLSHVMTPRFFFFNRYGNTSVCMTKFLPHPTQGSNHLLAYLEHTSVVISNIVRPMEFYVRED